MRWETARELSGEFWTFFVASLFVALSFSMYVFLYSLFLLDIGFNEKQIGLVAGAMTIGIMAATLPIGALARRFGVRRVMMIGFVLTSVVCVARLYVSSEHAQIALAFVTGLAMCHWQVCYSPVIAALTIEKNRTFAFSLLMSFGITVGAVGGLLGGNLPGWVQRFYPLLHSADLKRAVLLLCVAIYAMALWPVSRLKLHAVDRRQRTPWRLDPFLARFLPVIALWKPCLRMTANTASAEDLTQEAFLQLFRKIGTFRGESAFSTWLHRMAVNVVLMQLRKKGLPVVPLEETMETEEDAPRKEPGADDPRLAGSIDRMQLQRSIKALPPGYRMIFLLHDVEGYEHNEIAEIVGCSIGNSKSQLHKARMKLRELLKTSRAEKAKKP